MNKIALSLLAGVWSVLQAQKKEAPLTLAQVLTGLQTQGVSAENRTLTARNQYIARRVRERGVTFPLNEAFESELRNAGASNELVKAIRENSPATEDLGNNVKLEMVALPGGTFTMGSNDGDADEKPPHQVTLSPFSIGKYEVTQAQYRAVMGTDPSYFKGDDRPVEQVSWDDAVSFCRKLSQQSGKTYRLPTEAEWEYACRAGSSGDYAGNLNEMAWYSKNSSDQTHSVGQKKPNAFGLFDMHGNVWEWCQDLYDANYYKQSLGKDPQGPSSGTNRVLRGGSWIDFNYNCRSAYRNYSVPDARININGFRVVAGERTQ